MLRIIALISIGVLTIVFILVILFLYPRMFLKLGYSKALHEGNKSSDNTYYVTEDKYSQVIEKYELVKNFKNHKKYAVITLKDDINVASFGIYSFDINSKAFDYMKVNFSDVSKQVVVEVKKNTFGLYVFPISYNDKENTDYDESGIRLFRNKVVLFSIFSAITSGIFSVAFSLLLSMVLTSDANPLYVFTLLGNIGIYILMVILAMVIVGVGSYFTIFFTNRNLIDEEMYE